MIISDLVGRVIKKLNRDDDDIVASAVTWLTESYTAISAEYPFVELQKLWKTTSSINAAESDRRFYPLPSNTRAILMVDLEDPTITVSNGIPYHRALKKTSYREIFGHFSGIKRAFQKYGRWADCLIVDCPPDREDYGLTVFLWMYPDVSSAENSTILTPVEWNEILIWGAVWRGLNEHLDYERAKEIYQGVLVPLIQPKLTKMKAHLEMQDWDISFRFLQEKYTPVV